MIKKQENKLHRTICSRVYYCINYTGVGIMKRMLLLTIPIFFFYFNPSIVFAADDQCYTCHSALEDKESKLFKRISILRKGFRAADATVGIRVRKIMIRQ